MCGSPDFNFSTFPAFVFFLVILITLLVFQEKSRFIGNCLVSRFPEMFEAKIVFFWSRKSSKTVSSSINQTHCRVMESELKFPTLGPTEGIHSHWLQIRKYWSKGDEQRNSQRYSFGAVCHLYLTTQKSLICTASAKQEQLLCFLTTKYWNPVKRMSCCVWDVNQMLLLDFQPATNVLRLWTL